MNLSMHQVEQVIVIVVSGRIDIESAQKFQALSLNHFVNTRVVFDCSGLSFVGSTGISLMIESLAHMLMQNPQGLRVSGLANEFAQILYASIADLHIYRSAQDAIQSLRPVIYASREPFASLENPD